MVLIVHSLPFTTKIMNESGTISTIRKIPKNGGISDENGLRKRTPAPV